MDNTPCLREFSAVRVSVPVIALCLAVAALSANHAAAQFVEAPKPKPLRKLPNSQRSIFGYVTVPENRSNPGNSRTIQLAVLILPAQSANPQPDPVFYLVGGPGGSATLSSGRLPVFNILNQDRDIVFVDPRGAGFSLPNLFMRRDGFTVATFASINQDYFERRGIDLAAYRTTEIAQDYEDVRIALGYGQINLFASSYGTFVAQEMLRRFPGSLRAVVMSGNSPATDPFLPTVLKHERNGINALIRDVRRDPAARRAFPQFRRTFLRLVTRLTLRPIRRTFENRDTGKPERVTIDAPKFLNRITIMLQRTETMRFIPLMVGQMSRGHYVGLVRRFFRPREELRRENPFGMYLSVLASDFARGGYVAETRRGTLQVKNPTLVNAEVDDLLLVARLVQNWRVPYNPGTTRQLPQSTVRTLLVNGEMDAQTPVSGGAQIAAGLPNSTNYIYPRVGHAVGFLHGPDLDAAVAFIRDPDNPPAFSVGSLRRPRFYVTREPRSRVSAIDDWEDRTIDFPVR